jgi:hypothetical protein
MLLNFFDLSNIIKLKKSVEMARKITLANYLICKKNISFAVQFFVKFVLKSLLS